MDKKVQEEEQTIRKILSRVMFLQEDLGYIGRCKVKTKELRQRINEIKEKVDSLKDLLLSISIKI